MSVYDNGETADENRVQRPTTLSLFNNNRHELDEEDEELDEWAETAKKSVETSTTWPLMSNDTKYDLKEDHNKELDQLKASVTSDQIEQTANKYIHLPSAFKFDSIKQDKCFQVNPLELPGNNMIDIQTQMTPPVSPVKASSPPRQKVEQAPELPAKKAKVSVSVGTETDTELVVEQIVQTEVIPHSHSIATQTMKSEYTNRAIEEEEEIAVESLEPKLREKTVVSPTENKETDLKKRNTKKDATTTCSLIKSVKTSPVSPVNKIDQELDDEQCLAWLQDMKQMDDDIKSELNKINHQEDKKNELIELIKNYNTLSSDEKCNLEGILNSLNKNNKPDVTPTNRYIITVVIRQ